MKNIFAKTTLATLLAMCMLHAQSQTNVYSVTSGELIFSWADINFSDDYTVANPNDEQVANPLRFTAWFHLGQYVHLDFTDNFGLYSGFALRNVGLISDEKLNLGSAESPDIRNHKIIRRSYTVGLPLALKFGSFDNHFYIFGGGEMELAYAYKEKYWESHSRSGAKTKEVTWFGDQTPRFMPSVFAGVQMPGGINIKLKYYLNDFLNQEYKNSSNKISDLTRYETSQVMYVSVSWQFNTGKMAKKAMGSNDKITAL